MKMRKKKHTPNVRNRQCTCSMHKQLTIDAGVQVSRLYTMSSREHDESSRVALVEGKLFGARAKYCCNVCLDHGEWLQICKKCPT